MQNDIRTSKSAPNPSIFCTFDFEMCLAAQRCALFRHVNFQECSETVSVQRFWLLNVLRATTACTFSTCQLPKVVRTSCAFHILTWKCALCHNGVHFFDMSTSKRGPTMVCFVHFDFEMCLTPQWRAICHLSFGPWLRTRRFSEPTFRPSGAINHFTVFRDFLTSSSTWIFFLLTFSSLIFFLFLFPSLTLPISAFHMSILSEIWLPSFLRSIGYEFYTKGIFIHDELNKIGYYIHPFNVLLTGS